MWPGGGKTAPSRPATVRWDGCAARWRDATMRWGRCTAPWNGCAVRWRLPFDRISGRQRTKQASRGALEPCCGIAESLRGAGRGLQRIAKWPQLIAPSLPRMLRRPLAMPPFCAGAPILAVEPWSRGAVEPWSRGAWKRGATWARFYRLPRNPTRKLFQLPLSVSPKGFILNGLFPPIFCILRHLIDP